VDRLDPVRGCRFLRADPCERELAGRIELI
jgi:hypothetical protein